MPGIHTPPPQPFGTVPHPALQREFPTSFRAQIPIEFWPARPERIVGDVLEIGPGRGDFLLAEAAAHPEQRFVAIEIGKKRFTKLGRRVEKRSLSNVSLIYGDARLVIPRHLGDSTFGAIVVLFPDPWPKRRHSFNRLLQPAFLVELTRVLKPAGLLHLKSDVDSYVAWVAKQARDLPQLRVVEDRWPWGPVRTEAGETRSLYADRQTGLGYQIHSLCLERVP